MFCVVRGDVYYIVNIIMHIYRLYKYVCVFKLCAWVCKEYSIRIFLFLIFRQQYYGKGIWAHNKKHTMRFFFLYCFFKPLKIGIQRRVSIQIEKNKIEYNITRVYRTFKLNIFNIWGYILLIRKCCQINILQNHRFSF